MSAKELKFSADAREQIDIGGNEKYTSLCRKHYFEGNIG